MTNTMNTPIEEMERSFPILIRQYELRPDSTGLGEYRGGSGIIRSYQALAETTVTILSDRGRNRPKGRFHGEPGASTEAWLYKKIGQNLRKSKLPVKTTIVLERGDVIEIRTAGGGGYGNQRKRDASRIKRDLENEIVTSQPTRRR